MSWYNSSVAKARQEDTPRNPVILATCQVIEQEACAGGRREGDILLHVLPKSRGQQYRVRGDVRARLTRGLAAPLIIGLLPDTRLQP